MHTKTPQRVELDISSDVSGMSRLDRNLYEDLSSNISDGSRSLSSNVSGMSHVDQYEYDDLSSHVKEIDSSIGSIIRLQRDS
jgi:hypothetical protein